MNTRQNQNRQQQRRQQHTNCRFFQDGNGNGFSGFGYRNRGNECGMGFAYKSKSWAGPHFRGQDNAGSPFPVDTLQAQAAKLFQDLENIQQQIDALKS